MKLGSTINGAIGEVGVSNSYEFSGTTGQLLWFDTLAGSASISFALYSPTGALVINGETSDDAIPLTLTESGSYRLVVDGDGEATGNYTFSLLERTEAQVLELDTTVAGAVEGDGATKLYQLAGSQGQTLNFDLDAVSGVNWQLYDPGNGLIASSSAGSPDTLVALSSDGLYTLAITGTQGASYNFLVSDTSIAPVSHAGLGIAHSGTVSGTEVDSYSFTVNAGTAVLFDSLEYSSTGVRYRLVNPDGSYALDNQAIREDRLPSQFPLVQTGDYTLEVYGSGSYEFQLLELPGDSSGANFNPLELGAINSGSLNPGRGTAVYSFVGRPGQQVYFNGMVGNNVTATLLAPSNATIFALSDFDSDDSSVITLDQSGVYHLVVQGEQNSAANYQLQLLDFGASEQMQFNLPTVGSLATGRQMALYNFEAGAGDRVYFDSLSGSSSNFWQLYAPGGQEILTSVRLNTDFELELPSDGNYTLAIIGSNSTSAVDYSFRAFRYQDANQEAIITPGTGETQANEDGSLAVFPVQLQVNDGRGGSALQDYQIRLWADPDNAAPAIISTPGTRYGLNKEVYQYQVEALDPDADTLTYRLVDAPLGALIDSETGELLWFPETAVAGNSYEFTVEVADGRGGKDLQNFSVEVTEVTASIRGGVFDDFNNNGYRDTSLVLGDDSNVVFVIDVSGSAGGRTVDWRTANVETVFAQPTSILDRELATVAALNEQLIDQGRGNNTNVSIVLFDGSAWIQDLDPATPGVQTYTTPLADNNNNGILDITEALNINSPEGGTDFTPALQTAQGLLQSLPGSDSNLIFLSDGYGELETGIVEQLNSAGVNITALGIGQSAGMEQLRLIDPNAIQVSAAEEIVNLFSGWDDRYALEPLLENVTVYLDLNNNGTLDSDEPWQLTQADDTPSLLGNEPFQFSFDNLLPGSYTLRQVVPNGYTQTAPVTDAFLATITLEGSDLTYLFGNHRTSTPVNQNPVFTTTPPSDTLLVGDTLRYQVQASDGDADELTYELTLAPDGAVIDGETGYLVWQPTAEQVGSANLMVRVSDGRGGFDLQYFQLEVEVPNRSPVFTSSLPVNATAQQGKAFSYQARAFDADGDLLTYELISAPNGLTLDASTGLVSWTPEELAEVTFTLKASDGRGGEALQDLSLSVIAAQANTTPVIVVEEEITTGEIAINPRSAISIGNPYLYQLPTSDSDGDSLSYSLISAPTGLELTPEGFIAWTPTLDQFGEQTVEIEFNDGQGGVGTVGWTVNVTQAVINNQASQAINQAPQILSQPGLVTNLGKLYQYQSVGYDPDGDLLLWGLDAAPLGMVIDPQTGAISWQPKAEQVGEHQVKIELFDHLGLTTTQEFTLRVQGVNNAPQIVSTPITLAGAGQEYSYQVAATDAEGDELTYTLGIAPDGLTIDSNGLISWNPLQAQVGSHEVEVVVGDSQGARSGQVYSLVVQSTQVNQAPTITSTPVYQVDAGSTYSYQIVAEDGDGDSLSYELISAPTGMTLDAATGELLWNNSIAGSHQVVVAVSDGNFRAGQSFTLQAQENLAPVINSTAPTTVNPDAVYRYDVNAFDPNGDSLSYSLDNASIAAGITIDQLGRLRWTPSQAEAGINQAVTISVTDELGATTTQNLTIAVNSDNEAPQVNIQPSFVYIVGDEYQADLNSQVRLRVSATDNVGVSGLQLYVNNSPIALDANGIATITATNVGNLNATAIAYDAAGNISEVTESILIVDTSVPDAPLVDIDLDALGEGILTAPTQIIGSVTDSNLDYYILEYRPTDGSAPWREMFQGNSTVTDGALGTFDPTVLANGSYQIRLSATDTSGQTASIESEIEVAGELKLGNFQLSFTDLTIPVSGIPITVARTYDTLTANSQDDFGYGWRLEFRDTNLQTSLPEDEVYEELGVRSVPFTEGTRVYITLPGGERQGFTFKTTPDPLNALLQGFAGGIPDKEYLAFYHPEFEADEGVTSTLSVTDQRLIQVNGNEYYGLNSTAYNPADPLFGGIYTLTTQEGIVYKIDGESGDLISVSDTNGNKLTFSESGISSDSGINITFERDAQGRITSVIDPEGNEIGYEYDANGDLVAVTDRENNTTRFDYHEEREHYLEEIIDPLGRSGIRSEYDELGRLSKILDVNGEAVELVYDPDNSTQTVLDVFGNPTTYVYDQRGNILTEVDALGGITERTFDENNNLLTQTDSHGNTTEYVYDRSNNLVSITDPLGNTAYYTYNRFGQVISRTDPLGHTITYAYDDERNLLSTTNPQGQSVNETTDEFGNTTSIIDAEGNVTQFEYDGRGNVARKIDALGNETTYTYDSNGNQLTETVKVTTPEGLQELTTSWTYDTEGQVLTKTDPAGNVIRQEYDNLGNLATIVEEGMNNRRIEYRYDDKNQLIETIYPDGTSDRIIYDEAGRKITEIDRAGQTTYFVYDALNRLIETIEPDDTPHDLTDNPRTKTEYNSVNQAIASIDEQGNRSEYEYDAAGRRILKRDALGNETTYTYDAMGNLLTETDALGRTTSFVYDPQGRKVETHFADGTYVKTTYNVIGLNVSQTNQAGQTTHFIYDPLDRLVEVIYPDETPDNLLDNPRIKNEYDELGRILAQIDELGNRTEYEYDAVSRQTLIRNAEGDEVTYTYDAVGNRLTQTDPFGRTTHFEYDELDRLTKIYFPDGTYSVTTYDELGRAVATTDQAGKTTHFEYDPQDRLTAVVDAVGQKTEYTYDLAGNLIQIQDANNQTTEYEYDELNRRTATILPMGQRLETIYDPVGNITSVTDFNGDTITYVYDPLNRMTSKLFPDNTAVEYTYTSTGLIESISDQRGTIHYDYDVRDRLTERIDPDGQFIRYTYDAASNRSAIITSSGITSYTYDQLNRLETVTDPNLQVTEYTYDKVGNLIRTEHSNNTLEIRSYDNLNRLVFLEHTRIDPNTGDEVAVISSYDYTLDAVGNRLSILEDNGRLIEYEYDDLYRLNQEKITEEGVIVRTIDYTYDPIGNRLSRNSSDEGLTTYTYNNNDWLLTEEINGEVTTYTYDNNGNTLSEITDAANQIIYTWDYENRLLAAQVTTPTGTTETQYQYDTEGIRIASIVDGVETRYLVDTNRPYAQVLEEYAPDGTVEAYYTYGHDLISQVRDGQQSFYHVDGLGSTRALTDANGNVTDTYNYDAYGNLADATGNTVNHYLYTGEQYDSNLGNYYLRARYYDPSVGRFTARDPFEGFLSDPLSLAKYPYVHGNPVNATDPSGLLKLDTIAVLQAVSALHLLYRSSPTSPIGSIDHFDTGNDVVPGYLKDTNNSGVNRFINVPITNTQYQVIESKVENCNKSNGNKNCDFSGFPIIYWGKDLPDIHKHTRDAISQGKPSFIARAAEVDSLGNQISGSIWSRLHPQGLMKRYPGRDNKFPAQWYDFTPECPWDNNNPQASVEAARGLDCDEYPYHSTLQGGRINYEQGNVSLRRLDSSQNDIQGDWLKNFYFNARVAKLHPYYSWFGVKATDSPISYWEDRQGNSFFMGGNNPIPF